MYVQALRKVSSDVETSMSCYGYGCTCNDDWFVVYNDFLKATRCEGCSVLGLVYFIVSLITTAS